MRRSPASSRTTPLGLGPKLFEQLIVLAHSARDQLGRRDVSPVPDDRDAWSRRSARRRRRGGDDRAARRPRRLPTPRPSTNVTPACTWSASRALSRASSTTEPFSASKIPLLRDTGLAREPACAASIRYSPWIGMTARGRTKREHRPQLLRARVPGHVHRRDLLVEHLGAELREAG